MELVFLIVLWELGMSIITVNLALIIDQLIKSTFVANCNQSYCYEHENKTFWKYVPIDATHFKMVPTRRILTPFIDYNNIFLVSIAGRENETKLL
jgi:hypothetical protein